MSARFPRCGHGTGPLHPGDHKAVAEFTAMLTARQRPAPWTGRGDIAVRITRDGLGLERGGPADAQQPDADPVALVLIHPDTETALTSTLQCARTRIHGACQGKRPSPDCGHRYKAPSTAQKGGTYAGTATATWAVEWTAAALGDAGGFTETRSTPFTTDVREVQVLN